MGVCACARVAAAPRQSWLGCWGVRVFVCVIRLYSAAPGWGVRCGCVCLGLVSAASRHSWLGCWVFVCVCVRAPLVPRHSWLGCAVCVCVFELGFQLRPATPGLGAGVCVCLCVRSAHTPPLLAGPCGVGVCVRAQVLAAPRHSWLGCWGVCVCLCARSACTPPLLAGVCDVGVCFGSDLGCAPPRLVGVSGCVSACVRAPLVPRHSCLGCAVWVCMFGLGSRLPPSHSWLRCWAVCVFVCALRLYPATPGWAVRCVCLCGGSGFDCAPPLLAGVLGFVCVYVRVPLVPRNSWLGCAVWVCVSGLGFWLCPATPGWGDGVCVCLCARSLCTPLSWVGCAVWVCVFGLGLRLRPATPGRDVDMCVCLCACSASTPPLQAGLCRVGVGVWARVSAAPRHS